MNLDDDSFHPWRLPPPPSSRQLRFAPELSSLILLEATLTTSISVLVTEIPELASLSSSTSRHIPQRYRLARILVEQAAALRSLLAAYHSVVINAFDELQDNDLPF